ARSCWARSLSSTGAGASATIRVAGEALNYIVLAIPVFLLLIVLELVITRIQEKEYYRLSDSISDLGCGILQQLLEVFVKTALFAGYLFLHARYRLFDMPSASVPVWIACFL